jgi:hypothetical protein
MGHHSGQSICRLVAVLVLIGSLLACTGPGAPPGNGTPPPQTGGPAFVISSPQAGAKTAGTVFFSVQPLNPNEVASVSFRAGDRDLGPAITDGFRVFLNARDFPEGPLSLTATVTGRDGRTSSQTITVANVPHPPSTATVGPDGVALGTLETTGALSTLTIPSGVGAGATVTFAARTQEEIKAMTGVDYDALGVTFLGAQEVDATQPLNATLGVSSGGFGPRVQPGQAVVNYIILPDADGDEIGELVVVNTASVAPNGDVISDPVPQVQLAGAASLSQLGTSSLQSLANGIAGPPGTRIELEVSGFNGASPFGNVAVFESAGGVRVELLGLVFAPEENGPQRFFTTIPALPPGAATLTLHNAGTGFHGEPIGVTVQAPPALDGSPVEVIEGTLSLMLEVASALDTVLARGGQEGLAALGQALADTIRARVEELSTSGSEEDARQLREMAAMLRVGDVDGLLSSILADLVASGLRAAQAGCNDILDRTDRAFNLVSNGTQPLGMETAVPGWMVGQWWSRIKNAANTIDREMGGNACRPPRPPPPGPGGRFNPTGMGSALPPGGNLGGGAGGGGLRNYSLRNQMVGPFSEEPGRYVVKLFSRGVAIPFSGTTDAGGYFFIPLVPAGEPFVAVATDTVTGETRRVEGIGPEFGEAGYVFFDFAGEGPGTEVVRWDGGGDGTSWHDPFNWEGDILPLPTSDVVIDVPGEVTVVHSRDETAINSLVSKEALILSGGTLVISADASVEGQLTLSGGTLDLGGTLEASGATTWSRGNIGGGTLANRGTLEIVGEACCRGLTGTIDNAGTVALSGTGSEGLRGGQGAVFNNLSGATFDIQSDLGVGGGLGGDPLSFNNAGTVVKSAGTETSTWDVLFNNSGGSITVQSGTLLLRGGGTSNGGTFDIAAGAALDIGYGTSVHALSGTFSGSGAGVVGLTGGTFAVADEGAVLDFPNGGVRWTQGSIGGGTLTNQSLFEVVGEACCRGLTGSIDNAGTVALSGTGSEGIRSGQGAVFDNLSGATFDIQTDLGIGGGLGGDPLSFNNAGTVIKSAGAETSTWDVLFNNSGGSIEVQSGTLFLRGGGNSAGGTFDVAAGATLDIGLGTDVHTLLDTFSGSGAGFVQLTGGTLVIAEEGATFSFPNGGVRWARGTITGGTLTNQSLLEIIGEVCCRGLTGNLDNAGTVVLGGSQGFSSGQGAVFNNLAGALFDIQSDVGIGGGLGGDPLTFVNAGRLVKSGGTGTSSLQVCFVEAGGTVEELSGTLDIADLCP